MSEQKFEPTKVADIASEIGKATERVKECKITKENADHEYNKATTTLHNLQSELTRAVDGQLDMSILNQRAPARHVVTP